MLPSTFDENGTASRRQHLSCLVVDDCVAIDAGSLAMAANSAQRKEIRDVILTHAHLDHIAGLPLFIDDLFATLKRPVCVHCSTEVMEILERDVFNWDIYPRFTELQNSNGTVMKYQPFEAGNELSIKHLRVKSIAVNHKVPSIGFIISDEKSKFALTGDTAEMDEFWRVVNCEETISALLIECAFPDELAEIAENSHHLTPRTLQRELEKFNRKECPVYIINIKPMYRDEVIKQIESLHIENLQILEVGEVYEL